MFQSQSLYALLILVASCSPDNRIQEKCTTCKTINSSKKNDSFTKKINSKWKYKSSNPTLLLKKSPKKR